MKNCLLSGTRENEGSAVNGWRMNRWNAASVKITIREGHRYLSTCAAADSIEHSIRKKAACPSSKFRCP